MNKQDRINLENRELVRLASINFYKRTPKQTKRIHELIGFNQEEKREKEKRQNKELLRLFQWLFGISCLVGAINASFTKNILAFYLISPVILITLIACLYFEGRK